MWICEDVLIWEILPRKSSYNKILEPYKKTLGDKEKMNIEISEIGGRFKSIKILIQTPEKFDHSRNKKFLFWFTVTKWEIIKHSEIDKHSAYHCFSKDLLQLSMLPVSCHIQCSHTKSESVIPVPHKNPLIHFVFLWWIWPIYHLVHEQILDITGTQESVSQQLSLK